VAVEKPFLVKFAKIKALSTESHDSDAELVMGMAREVMI